MTMTALKKKKVKALEIHKGFYGCILCGEIKRENILSLR